MPSTTVGGWTSASLTPGLQSIFSPEASLNSARVTPATPSYATSGPGTDPVIAPDALSSIMSQIFGPNYQSLLNTGVANPTQAPPQNNMNAVQQAYVNNLDARTAAINRGSAGVNPWLTNIFADSRPMGGDFGSGVSGLSTQYQREVGAQYDAAMDPTILNNQALVGAAAARSPMPMLPGQGPQGSQQNSIMLPPSGWVTPASYSWTPPQMNTNMSGQANQTARLMGMGV